MIDVHCHLESPEYNSDREHVIRKCRKELNAVITSCAHPNDFQLTMKMANDHKGFVFPAVGLHPEFIKEINWKSLDDYFDQIKADADKIVSIGEVGLDYFWVKEHEWQQKEKDLFIQIIRFAKELDKPLTVHSRYAYEEVVKVLNQEDAKQVHLHLFGDNQLVNRIVENGWYVSIGPVILSSKKHYKIVRDMPIERLLLETDAPWNHPKIFTDHVKERNEPINVRAVAEKIAEIKGVSFDYVDAITTQNSVNLFRLKE